MSARATRLLALGLLTGGCALEVPPKLEGFRGDAAVTPDVVAPDVPVTPDATSLCPSYLSACNDRCVDTRVDALNCGACGQRCASGFCRDGACVSVCEAGTTSCGGRCVDTRSDDNHCGFCGHACSALPRRAACVDGACRCDDGFADCDGVAENGCETSLTTIDHCGTCINRCAGVHASATCSGGVCRGFACLEGWDNCDDNVGNGCETDLRAPDNCGACNNRCPSPAHATGVCVAPALRCAFVCNTRYADCNGSANDGCEANLDADNRNCGACGALCNGTCISGRCAPG